jgi:hypothetical protein
MKLSIAVPCYNESKNIPLILGKFSSVIKRDDVEVILVNNGSTDNSQEIPDMLIPKYSFARVVIVKENQGYGFGITSGLKEAKGEFTGYTHADMQTYPADPIKALEIISIYLYPIFLIHLIFLYNLTKVYSFDSPSINIKFLIFSLFLSISIPIIISKMLMKISSKYKYIGMVK